MKIIDIRPDERTGVFLLIFVMGILMLTSEATFVIATGGFLANIGVRQFPLLWVGDMGIVIIGATLTFPIIDRWPRKRLMSWLLLGMAVVYFVIQLLFALGMPDGYTYPLAYVMAELQFLVIPIVFWALANDFFNLQQTKRLFPIIAASGVVGGIVGNTLAIALSGYFVREGIAPHRFLIFNALAILIAYLVFQALGRLVPVAGRTSRKSSNLKAAFADGWDFIKNIPIFRYLAITMLGMGFALTMVEFLFLERANAGFQGADFNSFFGVFRIVQTVLIVLVQGLLATRLLGRLGLKKIFTLLPGMGLLILFSLLVSPVLVTATIARLLGRTTLFGVEEPSRKSLQGLIPDEKRGRVSTFLDGYLYTFGTILASLILLGLFYLPIENITRIYILLGLFASAIALWSAYRFWLTYDESLLDWRLARRKRGGRMSKLLNFDD